MAMNSDSSSFQLNGWMISPDELDPEYDNDDEEPTVEGFLNSLSPDYSERTSVKDWGLSLKAVASLLAAPELADEATTERSSPPFPAGYTPTTIELLYDDMLFVRSENGQVTYLRHCPDNYEPSFFEMRFDDQMALFLVEGEVVINRAIEMVHLETVLGRLRNVDWR
jgi:hypothetical protein